MEAAARAWARDVAARRSDVRRIVCFGSLAEGRWGVGSDLDLFIDVDQSERPYPERSLEYDTSALPVQADVIVRTTEEVERMRAEGMRFIREIDGKGLLLAGPARRGS